MARIYLDHNATAPPSEAVRRVLAPFLEDLYGNPSSIHWAGREAQDAVEVAREQVAEAMGAKARDVVFTGGGTEGDNSAVLGVLGALRGDRSHLIISAIEHPAVTAAADYAQRHLGTRVSRIGVQASGALRMEELEQALCDDTALVSVMLANNEIGSIQPVRAIAELAHEHGAWVHTDAVQALGKIPVDVTELGVDLLTVSGHKLGGLKGSGALWLSKGTPFEPRLLGGGQERGRRGGTHNVMGIVALGQAAMDATGELALEGPRLAALRDRAWELLQEGIPELRRNGDPASVPLLPNTLNISIPGVDGEGLLICLDGKGLALSSGSACSSGAREPSAVLKALGGEPWRVDCALRISLGATTTSFDVEEGMACIVSEVTRIRSLTQSPVRSAGGGA